MNHIEGGWPKDINMNDPEATLRYRRKIEKDDAYIHAVMHLGHVRNDSFYTEIIKLKGQATPRTKLSNISLAHVSAASFHTLVHNAS